MRDLGSIKQNMKPKCNEIEEGRDEKDQFLSAQRISNDFVVSALVESIIRERFIGKEAGAIYSHESIVRFLLEQLARMPDYLRFPMKCLTLLFNVWSLPFTGRTFHRLPYDRQLRQIRDWRNSSFGFRRDLIKFYETFTVFGWYSELYDPDH